MTSQSDDAPSDRSETGWRRIWLRSGAGRLHGVLPWAALFVPLSILAVVGALTWRSVRDDAEADMLRAAGSAAEYGTRTLESYSLAAGRVNDRLRGLSDAAIRADEKTLHSELNRISSELTQSELIYVVDRKGYPLLSSNLFPARRDSALTDREYFKVLSSPHPPAVHVSQTFVGRFDGRLLFSIGRRREDTGNPRPADGFDGIVLVSVSPVVLAGGMRRLLPEPTDRMALVRVDGYGISTTSGALASGEPLPKVDPASPFYDFASRGVEKAAYVSTTAMPGTESLLAMRLIDGFPIYAVSVRPMSEIVERWWSIMGAQLAFGLPATLGLLLLSLRVQRDQRRLATRNADLRRDNDLSADRLIRAKRFGLVGTFEFDPQTGMGRRSPEYMSVQGLAAIAAEESYEDWVARLHPDDRERAEAELRDACSPAGTTDYAQTYRIVTPAGEVRWIAARGEITRDAAGRAIMLLGAHVDVTPLRRTELALAESDARLRLAQEAVGIGVWEWTGAARSLKCSRQMMALCGFDEKDAGASLPAILSRLHPDDRSTLRRLVGRARCDGGFSGEVRLLRPGPAGEPETIWLAIRAKLVASSQSARPLLMGIAYDVTERKRAEELTTLIGYEVEHRAKNALAVVSSLLRMTKADSAAQLAQIMDRRVRALGQTMALLGRERWKGAELADIVMSELKAFELTASGDGYAIDVSGPPVVIGVKAAQPLSMALHELATNAAKYGALSTAGGSVEVLWRIERDRVHLTWRERGGPPLDGPPSTTGFGSRLIRMLFEGQMGGVVAKRWEPEGLVCEMSFPLTEEDDRLRPSATATELN